MTKSFLFEGSIYVNSRTTITKYNPDLDTWELIKEMDFEEIEYDKRYISIENVFESNGVPYYFIADTQNCRGLCIVSGYFYSLNLETNQVTLEFSQSKLRLSSLRASYNIKSTIFLLSSYRLYRGTLGSELTEFRHPFDVEGGKYLVGTAELNEVLYMRFNNGEFWSFDPTK